MSGEIGFDEDFFPIFLLMIAAIFDKGVYTAVEKLAEQIETDRSATD